MPDRITSRERLALLVRELSNEDTATWGNSDLTTFLEALSGWIGDCDGFYKNIGSDLDPDTVTWQLFADALQAAKTYE